MTPTRHFFIRSHFATPHLDLESWRLVVEGAVERPSILSYPEIRLLAHHEVVALLECAGNSRASVRPRPEGVLWRNGAVGTARWSGVPLRVLLERAKVKSGAVEVLFEGADHGLEPGVDRDLAFGMSISLAKALEPETLVATEMNGHVLPSSHGFPVRAVVPGWYGMASVKWLTRIVVLSHPYEGFYRTRAYALIPEGDSAERPKQPVTSVRVKSLMTWPTEGQVLRPGGHRLRGVAWSGHGPIARVEVSTGTGPEPSEEDVWQPAKLSPALAAHSWTHWEYDCEVDRPGFYVFRVRATDGRGHTQPAVARWNFRGLANNSIHAVPVEIRADGGAPAAIDGSR